MTDTQPPPVPGEGSAFPPPVVRPPFALRILLALIVVLFVIWLSLTRQLLSKSSLQQGDVRRFSVSQENYHVYEQASQLLKRGSDTLTDAARRYVVTGDAHLLDDFVEETERRRRRDRALELVDRTESISPDVRRTLHEAMEGSEALVALERRAMRLAAAARHIPDESLPETFRRETLEPGDAELPPAEQASLAARLLFDDDYFRAKSEIWNRVNEFLDRSMEEELANTRREIDAVQGHAAEQTRIISLRLTVLLLLFVLAFGAAFAVVNGKNRAYLRLMDELRRERDATLAAEKAKSAFFSMVSHDIRTPLNSIIGFSELLRDGVDDPAERIRDLDNIVFCGQTLLSLVNDVLDLSKLDADKMVISPAPLDFPALLARVAEAFRLQSSHKGVSIRVAAGPMPRLLLDEERVRQILVNLVGNAVKFTENGEVAILADFRPNPGEASGLLRFSVSDTGIGIAPADQSRILEPFVQVAGTGAGGTGLGLSICKRLLKRMGGDLSLESELGRGSTFTASIPDVAVAEPAPAPGPLSAAAPSALSDAAESRPAPPPQMEPLLVVDDVPINLMVEKALLAKAGLRDVITAGSGDEALRCLRDRQFRLVLTDLWMPGMDGYALCEAIRADPALASVPVYAVTADVEARKSATDRGFDGVLLKPITTQSLADFLREVRAHAA